MARIADFGGVRMPGARIYVSKARRILNSVSWGKKINSSNWNEKSYDWALLWSRHELQAYLIYVILKFERLILQV